MATDVLSTSTLAADATTRANTSITPDIAGVAATKEDQSRLPQCQPGPDLASRKTSLARLPREVLDNIASFLPTKDFSALRLACKQIEDKIFPYWTNSFFRKKQFSEQPTQHLVPAHRDY